jgi:hypothetical protein
MFRHQDREALNAAGGFVVVPAWPRAISLPLSDCGTEAIEHANEADEALRDRSGPRGSAADQLLLAQPDRAVSGNLSVGTATCT